MSLATPFMDSRTESRSSRRRWRCLARKEGLKGRDLAGAFFLEAGGTARAVDSAVRAFAAGAEEAWCVLAPEGETASVCDALVFLPGAAPALEDLFVAASPADTGTFADCGEGFSVLAAGVAAFFKLTLLALEPLVSVEAAVSCFLELADALPPAADEVLADFALLFFGDGLEALAGDLEAEEDF